MNDQDYIRKAVELADGWEFIGVSVICSPSMTYVGGTAMPECLDALAAQLVRQVDAKMGVSIRIVSGAAEIRVVMMMACSSRTTETFGPDRTMNTIKAIVDSGVLEHG